MPLCGSSQSTSMGVSKRPVTRKIICIGDGACGKTSLLNVYIRGTFPEVYEPTIFENHVVALRVDDTDVELSLWDTAGQEEFEGLRSLSYADTNVVLLCFSVDQPVSLENVEARWLEEIISHCEGVKLCLVALKCDLRDDETVRQRLAGQYYQAKQRDPSIPEWMGAPIAYDTGLAVARRIRASRYLECSARHNRGVTEAFREAARVAVAAPARGAFADGDGEKSCVIA